MIQKSSGNKLKKCYPAKGKSTTGITTFSIDGLNITNEKQIANGFCTFFTNIGKTYKRALSQSEIESGLVIVKPALIWEIL